MENIKISIVTVVFNAQHTIERCIESVARQGFKNVQHIIIDGGSTDDTLKIIKNFGDRISILISEPDQGIYDAMNKGISLADGDVIGTLNADDYLADDGILTDIATAFMENPIDVVYGDLDYIDSRGNIVRKWLSGKYKAGKFNWGWMPPHPTFYCRKDLFVKFGSFKLDYGSAADYELMLRYIHVQKVTVHYLNKVFIKMVIGGVSNKNLKNRLKATLYDLKAMRNNGIAIPYLTIAFKPLRKVTQFLSR